MAWNQALSAAISKGRLDGLVVDDVDALCPKGLRNYLHDAAGSNQLRSVQWLLARGAAPDGVGAPWSPLHAAAEMGYSDICRVLMEAGADLSALEFGRSGGTPVVLALFYGHAETAELLARDVIVPRNLRTAGGLGRIDMLNQLHNTPQAGSARQWYRPHDEYPEWTPSDDSQEIVDEALVYATQNQRSKAVHWLLAHGARADAMPYYASALHVAMWQRNDEIIEALLATNPELTVVDRMHDGTPIGWARHFGHVDLAERMMRR